MNASQALDLQAPGDTLQATDLTVSRRPPASFWLTAALACAGWCLHASLAAEDGRTTTTSLITALAVFYGLPPVMAFSMTLVCAVPCLLLGPLALLVRLITARPTGFRSLLVDMTRPGRDLVPGYVTALRGVRSPVVWGLVVGSTLAALPLLLWTSTAPPAG